VDDELELVIVKDMMLTGFDAPPLHTLYLDRPLKGALLMQTLARVNRTFRGKEDGLLVAYAPLAENLAKALGEYTQSDQANKPVGKNIDEAVGAALGLVDTLRGLLAGYDWKGVLMKGGPKAFVSAATGAANYLRSPETPGNQPAEGDETLASKYRRFSSQLSGVALCSGRDLGGAAAGDPGVRGDPRLDGKVRRRRPASQRRTRSRRDPATAGEPHRYRYILRRSARHL
jgi:type I restriction enzyme R subunit